MDTLTPILTAFAALLGFPAFLTILISLGKQLGWIADGVADKVSFYGNLLAFIGVAVAVATGNLELLGVIDTNLSAIAKLLSAFAVFATEIGLTKIYYAGLRGTPIGYSYSLEREKAASG